MSGHLSIPWKQHDSGKPTAGCLIPKKPIPIWIKIPKKSNQQPGNLVNPFPELPGTFPRPPWQVLISGTKTCRGTEKTTGDTSKSPKLWVQEYLPRSYKILDLRIATKMSFSTWIDANHSKQHALDHLRPKVFSSKSKRESVYPIFSNQSVEIWCSKKCWSVCHKTAQCWARDYLRGFLRT